MEVISDISSISTYNSMPPLIDMFGRLVIDNDEQTTITDETMSLPVEPWAQWEEEEPEYHFHRPPAIEIPQNTHLYFSEDGNEITREQFEMNMLMEQREQQEQEAANFAIRTPLVNHRFTMRHPRVILDFLRFLDSYNEVAEAEDVFMIQAIPHSVLQMILNHPSIQNTPPEFQNEVNELRWRLERHADLSELSQN